MTLPIVVAIMAAKAVAVVLFAMLLAAALTWADRRQGANSGYRIATLWIACRDCVSSD